MQHPAADPIQEKLARIRDGRPPRVVDLFSGCGGMSLGFQRAGCEIVAGIEKDEVRARTHAANFHPGDIELHGRGRDVAAEDPLDCLRRLGAGENPRVDIVVGGPPCQAYARVGRAKLREIGNHPEAYLRDDRGGLYAAYVAWVEALQPVAVVMENVPDILNYGGVNVGEIIAQSLDRLGYEVRYNLLNAAHYGVPQTRERMFLIGVHREAGVIPRFPERSHHLDLPVGYQGTRAHAARWTQMTVFDRPAHASPLLPRVVDAARSAVSCEEALSDLPIIPEARKVAQKRCARDLTERQAYSAEASSEYQRTMRTWKGFETQGTVSSHVIRSLPRDYEIFRRMRPGDEYPAAHQIALAMMDERVERERASGRQVEPGSEEWTRLLRETVPPYDPGKFPNKWRKLERDAPSRTLMAHLSHDSYSHIHYDDAQARTISVREAARLQSFPDAFEFCGAMNAAFGQIGNAVPPLLASSVGSKLIAELRQTREVIEVGQRKTG
ncbi:MAG: DNA cytosine methyltransferase [Deltaproteobacteria bacterium]|nr:DNA cytosine methyltransferase [Deltaproteobacteria bacterium]